MDAPLDLVIRARDGDRAALAALVAAVQADVWRLMVSRLGRGPDAEDATQETFRQAIESLGTLREPRAFAGWLVRIALEKAKLARRGRRIPAAHASTREEEAMPVEREETREKVREAMAGLEEELRETVELRYEHGLGYAEIAQAMEVPEGTVSRRLHTAHERLRKALAGAGIAMAVGAVEAACARGVSAGPVPEGVAKRLSEMARTLSTRPPSGRPLSRRARVAGFAGAGAVALVVAVLIWREGAAGRVEEEPPFTAPAIAASPAGGAENEKPVEVGDKPRGEPAPVDPAPAAKLRGRVTDRTTGAPLKGARIRAIPDGKRDRAVVMATDEDGRYAGVTANGGYMLEVSAEGYAPAEMEETLTMLQGMMFEGKEMGPPGYVRIGDEETVRDFALRPGTRVRGVLIGLDGTPRPKSGVNVQRQSVKDSRGQVNFAPRADGQGFTGVTDAEGRFEYGPFLPEGQVVLVVSEAGCAPIFHTVDLGPPQVDVTLRLERAQPLTGRVTDPAGASIAGAEIAMFTRHSDPFVPQRRTRSDKDGRFTFPHKPADAAVVVALASGRNPAVLDVTGNSGAPLAVVLDESTAVLRGRLLDASGDPVRNTHVRVGWIGFRAAGLEGSLSFGVTPPPGDADGFPGLAQGLDLPPPAIVLTDDTGGFELKYLPVSAETRVRLVVKRGRGWEPAGGPLSGGEFAEVKLAK